MLSFLLYIYYVEDVCVRGGKICAYETRAVRLKKPLKSALMVGVAFLFILVDVLDVDVVVLHGVQAVLFFLTRTRSPPGVEGFGFVLPFVKLQRELLR